MNSKSYISQYGFFAVPTAISLLTLQVYMPTYFVQTSSLSLTTVGLIFLLARLFDTFSDPIVGYLSDNSRSRFGPRLPWIVIGCPFFILSFAALIYVPVTDSLQLLGILITWYGLGTALIIPYYALAVDSQNSSSLVENQASNRFISLSASRAGFGLCGTIFALIMPTVLGVDDNLEQTIQVNFYLIIATFCLAIPVLFRLPNLKNTHHRPVKFQELFQLFKKGSDFNILMVSQLLNGISNALPATLFVLFSETVLNDSSLVGPLLILYFLSAVIAMLVWVKLAKKYGKPLCWQWAMTIASVVFMGTFFVDEQTVWLFFLITWITGLMAGADLSLPAAMLADIAHRNHSVTGKNRSALYYSVWGTTSKLTLAIAIGLAFPLLDIGAIVAVDQAPEINKTWLVMVYAVIPALLKLLSVWSLRRFS